MERFKENVIVKLTFEFSLMIIEFIELLDSKGKLNLSRQLFRSGTSIGANVSEAQNAESKSDFIHKMKIAAKEADETYYWLKLCKHSTYYPDCDNMLHQNSIIIKIIGKIISTSKQ